MMTIEQLTTFFGWAALINIGVLLFTTVCLSLTKVFVISVHSRLFDVKPEHLPALYFNYLAGYKTLTLIFCIVPYLSLKLMAN